MQERSAGGSGASALGNYDAYKPSTGAMGDRMSAMKSAFQVPAFLSFYTVWLSTSLSH